MKKDVVRNISPPIKILFAGVIGGFAMCNTCIAGSEIPFIPHDLTGFYWGANSAFAADFDNDGDIDVGQSTFAAPNHPVFSQPATLHWKMNQGGNPLGAAMRPEDLASAYLFLSSRDNAASITGSIVSVDAGSLLRWTRPA